MLTFDFYMKTTLDNCVSRAQQFTLVEGTEFRVGEPEAAVV